MIHIISTDNIKNINIVALNIVNILKSEKFFFYYSGSSDVRVTASCSLIELSRALDSNEKYSQIKSEKEENISKLKSLVQELCELLLNKSKFLCQKLKNYTLDIKPFLCKELISDLEDLFIVGKISMDDISNVYKTLSKPIPKKFCDDCLDDADNVYQAIKFEILNEAEEIKRNSIYHYIKMVKLIDPENKIQDKLEFLKIGKRKVSDMMTLKLCYYYKFNNEQFYDLINFEFDKLIKRAANQINSHYIGTETNPKIVIKNIFFGAKGFDIYMTIGDQHINARAIPVNGCFVRFHYRYIIT